MVTKNVIFIFFLCFSSSALAAGISKGPVEAEKQHHENVQPSKHPQDPLPNSSHSAPHIKSRAPTPDIAHPSEPKREKGGATALPGDNSGQSK